MIGAIISRVRPGSSGWRKTLPPAFVLVVLAMGGVVLLTGERGDADGAPHNDGTSQKERPRKGPAPIRTGTPVPSKERWVRGNVAVNHGVASGDVGPRSAVVWARADRRARMYVDLAATRGFRGARRHAAGLAEQDTDFAVTLQLRKLRPATRYFYRIWFSEPGSLRVRSNPVSGTFKTAPAGSQSAPLQFVFGGDVGGGNYCRHVKYGYPIFHYIGRLKPDALISLGDLVYGDQDCPLEGPNGWQNIPGDFLEVDDPSVDWTDLAKVQEIYFQHWRYTRADRQLRSFLAKTPIFSTWDDHEVMNDFGASWSRPNSQYPDRAGYGNLVDAGRRAFFSYGVLGRLPDDMNRIYRSFRWGQDLHLVITDTRSYRSRNEEPDGPAKTMLGGEQLKWLKRTLASSKATWKVVALSSPISVPTGSAEFGRDGFADGETGNGFERELVDLLRYLDERSVRNVVFITADLHFAQVTRNSRDYDGDGEPFVFHELVAGPYNARVRTPYWLDQTTNPQSLYGEGNFFNFGSFRIVPQSKGRALFRAETFDSFGKLRPESVVVLNSA